MTAVSRLGAADFQDAMDLMNLVFGASRPHDFERLLPAVYRPTEASMACLYAIREGSRLRAIVGMHPRRWRVGDTELNVAGIGGVATHPKARGRGHMRRLMSHCVALMRAEGVHLSYLGGQRQRYQYHGYERCGHAFQVVLNQANVRHAFGTAEPADPRLRFEALGAEQADWLARAQALHAAQPAACKRPPADFFDLLRSWHGVPWVALDARGSMVGYLVASSDGAHIWELAAASDERCVGMLRAWVAQRGSTTLAVSPLEIARVRLLASWCETVTVQPSGNWQIFDWPAVVGTLLRARAGLGPLVPGELRLGLGGLGTLCLCAHGDRTECGWTDAAPHLECDPFTAMRLLFGPLPPAATLPLPPAAAALEQWCPLPLYWPRPDAV